MLSNRISQSNTNASGSVDSTVTSSVNPNPSSVFHSTAGLEKGQLIRGEITDLRNNEVSVKLEDGRELTGKLEESGNLAIGDRVVFRVEEVSLKSLTLKIIANSDSASAQNTVEKALEAAGLVKNSRNNSIVKELLNQQMSIDKGNISSLIRQSLMHKEVPVKTLVLMNKYHIPVKEANIRQFMAYQNSEQNMLKEIQNLADSIPDLFYPSGDISYLEYLSGSSDLLNLLINRNDGDFSDVWQNSPGADLTGANLSTAGFTAPGKALESRGNITVGDFLSQSDVRELAGILESDSITKALLGTEFLSSLSQGGGDLREVSQALNHILNNRKTAISPETAAKLENSPAVQTIFKAYGESMSANNETVLSLSYSDRINLANALEEFMLNNPARLSLTGDISALKDRIIVGSLSSRDILKWIQANLNTADEKAVKNLLTSKEFKLLLKENLLSKWTADPKAITKNEDISRYFEGLINQINNLREYTEQTAASGKTDLQAQTARFQENISFMNILNEFFTYIQLPLKLKSQLANSELYVYSRKKSGRTAADGISVLLHLDMEHLGPLDIYLDLHDRHLVSKFYLEDSSAMQLITSNIPLLKNVLNEKGYTLNTEILKREKTVNVVEDFLKEDSGKASVSRYNFDLRV